MSFSPDQIYHQLISAGEDWSDKEAAASLLEESRKTVLSELMLSCEGSNAARETEALADQKYKEHTKLMVEARRVANRAKVRWLSVQVLAEARRTEAATRRAEMKLA